MLTVAEVNRRSPRCVQCGCLFNLIDVHALDQPQLRVLHGQNQFPLFAKALLELTNCTVGEAKATYLHLAPTSGACHRCGSVLPPGAVVDCPKCKSVNLVWSSPPREVQDQPS